MPRTRLFLGREPGAVDGRQRTVTWADVERLALRHSITPARVQQIEHGDNIEIATLVRVAAACGYQVGISLEPLSPGMRTFSTVLQGTTR